MSENTTPSGGRCFGYFLSIIINGAILYAVNNLHRWNIPYLTDRFSECLWAFNLSISATIFMYCTFLAFDRRWFRSLMGSLSNVFAFISLNVFRRIFPLDIPESAAKWVNIGILILLAIIALSVLGQLVSAIKYYRRSNHPIRQ